MVTFINQSLPSSPEPLETNSSKENVMPVGGERELLLASPLASQGRALAQEALMKDPQITIAQASLHN